MVEFCARSGGTGMYGTIARRASVNIGEPTHSIIKTIRQDWISLEYKMPRPAGVFSGF